MAQCIVIADDLTGANATGVLLTHNGCSAHTVMNSKCLQEGVPKRCDCVICPTDSRGIDSQEAYQRVYNATNLLKHNEVKVYSKRIDSTLRGNLGSETSAILDALDNGAMAIVVPCFPKAGRIAVGGHLLVNGVPLHRTEAAMDPKTPIDTSLMQPLFEKQAKYPVCSIYLHQLNVSAEQLAKELQQKKQQGNRIVVFDAISMEDIGLIAEAVVLSGLPFVAVDPGVFTAEVSKRLITPEQTGSNKKILLLVGSVNPVAAAQVEKLLSAGTALTAMVDAKEFLAGDEAKQREIDRVVGEIVGGCQNHKVCGAIGLGVRPENKLDLEKYSQELGKTKDELSAIINDGFAQIAENIIQQEASFAGLYACGGDIAIAVCQRFGAAGMQLADEVVPLAAYGKLAGGSYNGLHIITKGGMVGDENALLDCAAYLLDKIEQ